MKRVLALLAAVALVAGAVLVRDRLDSGDGQQAAGGPGPSVSAGVVACVDEVFEACRVATGGRARSVSAGEAIDLLVVDPLAEEDAEVDAWVLPRYVVEAVDAQRARLGVAPAFGEVSEPVAHTEVVPVVAADRIAPLEAACGRALDWACLADLAGRSWSDLGAPYPGPVRLGLDPPGSSATGLVAVGALGAAALGAVDPSQTETQAWFQDLERNRLAEAPRGQRALAVLATRAGTYDVATALVADGRAVEASNPRVVVAEPDPPATLDVVVAAGAGRSVDTGLAEDVAAELGGSGWEVGGATGGIQPAGDVLAALRNIFSR